MGELEPGTAGQVTKEGLVGRASPEARRSAMLPSLPGRADRSPLLAIVEAPDAVPPCTRPREAGGATVRRVPNAQLVCETCGYQAKRPLLTQVACRGFRETACVPARCPHGHGYLVRVDGCIQEFTPHGFQVVGHQRAD